MFRTIWTKNMYATLDDLCEHCVSKSNYKTADTDIQHCVQHITNIPHSSSPQSTNDMTTDYNKTDEHSQTTRKLTGHSLRKTQSPLSLKPPYPPIYTLPTSFSQTSY